MGSTDQEGTDDLENEGILAHHPIAFKNSFDIVSHETKQAPYRTTNRGLEIQMPIANGTRREHNVASFIGILSCHYETNLSVSIGIPLNRISERYYREKCSTLTFLQHEKAGSAELNTVHIHKSGKRRSQTLHSSYCPLARYPSEEIHFSDGIAVAAVISPSASGSDKTWKPGDLETQWNTLGKTIMLSAKYEGHFGVLEFTKSRGLGTNWGIWGGFVVVVRLFPDTFGIVAVIPWFGHERRTSGFLRRTLDEHYNAANSTRANLRVGNGNVRVVLQRTKTPWPGHICCGY